jgi:hypothetical protein
LTEELLEAEMVNMRTLKAAEAAMVEAGAAAAALEAGEAQSEGTCECFGVHCDVDNTQFDQHSICGRFPLRSHWWTPKCFFNTPRLVTSNRFLTPSLNHLIQ